MPPSAAAATRRRTPLLIGPNLVCIARPSFPRSERTPVSSAAVSVLARGPRTAVLVLALAAVIVVGAAAPAAAHGLGGLQPTNYETRILHVSPDVEGITVQIVDAGSKISVRNETRHQVVVLGYEGEPYLRIGPNGTFENIRSPATYLNRTIKGTSGVPDSADPTAPAAWLRRNARTTAQFHDHRAHWMGIDLPPMVRRDPGAEVLIQRWHIDLRVRDGSASGGTRIRISGDLRWVPGPSLWAWLAAALALALALAALARTRRWTIALAGGLAVLFVSSALHLAGAWGASSASVGSRLGESVYQAAGIAVAVVALLVFARRTPEAAVPWAFIAALFLLLTGGIADVGTLTHSQLPTTLPDWLDRLTVALTIGAGAGVAIVAALHVAPDPGSDRMRAIRATRGPGGGRPSLIRSRDTRARALRARSRNDPPASS